MRVLKKCYDFSQINSLLLIPKEEPASTLDVTSIYNTVMENDLVWFSDKLELKNSEMLEYKTSGTEYFN